MQVKIVMNKNEKIGAVITLIITLVIVYYINKKYLYILDAEFEDGKIIKLILKTGFLLPVKTEINFGKDTTESKVKFYGYLIKATPLKNKEGKATGEFNLDIYNNSKSKKPSKTVKIFTDDHYVKYLKTPLGRI